MDVSAFLKMVEDALYNCFLIIDFIVSNYERTLRSVLKHPYKGAQGQVLKSSKVKLDEEISDPSFLADPSHCVKVVARHIFSIINESKSQRCWCTKADALQLKKYWGYMIKIIGWKQLNSWVRQVRLLLNTCLTIITIVVESGTSRQEHQKK